MRIYEFTRSARIKEIADYVKEELAKGEKMEKRKLIIAIMLRYNVSRRTATDYLETAMLKNELE